MQSLFYVVLQLLPPGNLVIAMYMEKSLNAHTYFKFLFKAVVSISLHFQHMAIEFISYHR